MKEELARALPVYWWSCSLTPMARWALGIIFGMVALGCPHVKCITPGEMECHFRLGSRAHPDKGDTLCWLLPGWLNRVIVAW